MEIDSDTSSNNDSSSEQNESTDDNSAYAISEHNDIEESESLHTNGEWNGNNSFYDSDDFLEWNTEFDSEVEELCQDYISDHIKDKESTFGMIGLTTMLKMIRFQIDEVTLHDYLTSEMKLVPVDLNSFDVDYKASSNYFSVKRKFWETDIPQTDPLPKKKQCLNDLGDEDFEQWKDITKMKEWNPKNVIIMEQEETKEEDDDIEM